MSRFFFFIFFLLVLRPARLWSQLSPDSIDQRYIESTVKYLASDKLKGRVNYTKEQAEAAAFITSQFLNCRLKPFPGLNNYYVPFQSGKGYTAVKAELSWNGRVIEDSLFFSFERYIQPKFKTLNDYLLIRADPPLADSLLYSFWGMNENVLLWVNTTDSMRFSDIAGNLIIPDDVPGSDLLICGLPDEPVNIRVLIPEDSKNHFLYNLVGVLPGRSMVNEAIIFSAHYDHVDKNQLGLKGEIFNGANDNASGTAAVLALAKYYAQRLDNERTLIFCLFAGEELGLLGSKEFVKLVDTTAVKAVINIEMIGLSNAVKHGSFLVTGPEFSNLVSIFEKNVGADKVKPLFLKKDYSYLFMRSDNYPFLLKSIPAHTIMCSDDREPCYHKPCDDARRIDFKNMAEIVRSIAKACETLVNGKDTPRLGAK